MDSNVKPRIVVAKTTPQVTLNTTSRTAIRSVFPATLRYAGSVTSELYMWQKAGDVIFVATEDVAFLIDKRIGKGGCCGAGNDGNKLFELA